MSKSLKTPPWLKTSKRQAPKVVSIEDVKIKIAEDTSTRLGNSGPSTEPSKGQARQDLFKPIKFSNVSFFKAHVRQAEFLLEDAKHVCNFNEYDGKFDQLIEDLRQYEEDLHSPPDTLEAEWYLRVTKAISSLRQCVIALIRKKDELLEKKSAAPALESNKGETVRKREPNLKSNKISGEHRRISSQSTSYQERSHPVALELLENNDTEFSRNGSGRATVRKQKEHLSAIYPDPEELVHLEKRARHSKENGHSSTNPHKYSQSFDQSNGQSSSSRRQSYAPPGQSHSSVQQFHSAIRRSPSPMQHHRFTTQQNHSPERKFQSSVQQFFPPLRTPPLSTRRFPPPTQQFCSPLRRSRSPPRRSRSPPRRSRSPPRRLPSPSYQSPPPTRRFPSYAQRPPSPPRRSPLLAHRSPSPTRRYPMHKPPSPSRRYHLPVHRSPSPIGGYRSTKRQPRSPARSPLPVNQSPTFAREYPSSARQLRSPARRSPMRVNRSPPLIRGYPSFARQSRSPARRSPLPMNQSPSPTRGYPSAMRQPHSPARRSPLPLNRSVSPFRRYPSSTRQSRSPMRRSPLRVNRSPSPGRRFHPHPERSLAHPRRLPSPTRRRFLSPTRQSPSPRRSHSPVSRSGEETMHVKPFCPMMKLAPIDQVPREIFNARRKPRATCYFCDHQHWSHLCVKVNTLEARRNFYMNHNLCFNCGKDHRGKKCRITDNLCKWPHCAAVGEHHSALCTEAPYPISFEIVNDYLNYLTRGRKIYFPQDRGN